MSSRLVNWFVYYYAHFFCGVLVFYAMENNQGQVLLGLYAVMIVAALAFHFRLQLVVTLITGLGLFAAGKSGVMDRWPESRAIDYLGRTSYSLFLVHFPVLVLVATVWVWLGWTEPWTAVAGLMVAYVASLVASFAFYRVVEVPADRLIRRMNSDGIGRYVGDRRNLG